jgi:hypothetical protein
LTLLPLSVSAVITCTISRMNDLAGNRPRPSSDALPAAGISAVPDNQLARYHTRLSPAALGSPDDPFSSPGNFRRAVAARRSIRRPTPKARLQYHLWLDWA